jgi:hypothetical protein
MLTRSVKEDTPLPKLLTREPGSVAWPLLSSD